MPLIRLNVYMNYLKNVYPIGKIPPKTSEMHAYMLGKNDSKLRRMLDLHKTLYGPKKLKLERMRS